MPTCCPRPELVLPEASPHVEGELVRCVIGTEAFAFLAKSFSGPQLLAKVTAAVQRRRPCIAPVEAPPAAAG